MVILGEFYEIFPDFTLYFIKLPSFGIRRFLIENLFNVYLQVLIATRCKQSLLKNCSVLALFCNSVLFVRLRGK